MLGCAARDGLSTGSQAKGWDATNSDGERADPHSDPGGRHLAQLASASARRARGEVSIFVELVGLARRLLLDRATTSSISLGQQNERRGFCRT
jgi:hypothetical protein